MVGTSASGICGMALRELKGEVMVCVSRCVEVAWRWVQSAYGDGDTHLSGFRGGSLSSGFPRGSAAERSAAQAERSDGGRMKGRAAASHCLAGTHPHPTCFARRYDLRERYDLHSIESARLQVASTRKRGEE
jgi:hypothetical protein